MLGSEPIKPCGLLFVLGQSAAAALIQGRKLGLCERRTLVCGELVETRRFLRDSGVAGAAFLDEHAEAELRICVSLVGCEPVEARSFLFALCESAASLLVEITETDLCVRHALIGGKPVEPCGVLVVFSDVAAAVLVKAARRNCANASP